MKKFLLSILFIIFLIFAFLFGLDRETARLDYLENGIAEDCIFEMNCKKYN